MLTKEHLIIVKKIHQYGTLTKAAKELHLTQSALSHTIKKIESKFKIKIWSKTGRNIKFTQAGKKLLTIANKLLPQFEQAEESLHRIAEGYEGILNIGMECYPCYQWLIQITSNFIKSYPKVELDIKQRFQFGGLSALLNKDIDLLITPDPYPHKELISKKAFDYELVAITSKNHPLALQKFIIPEHLTNELLLTYPVPKERLDIYTQFLIPANKFPKKHKSMESIELMLQLVENQKGISVLPSWLAKKFQKTMEIQPIQLGSKGIHKTISIIIRKEDYEVPYIRSFLNQAKTKLI